MFLNTPDGERIAITSIVHIGKLEVWPHGYFHAVTYRMHGTDVTVRVSQDEIEESLL